MVADVPSLVLRFPGGPDRSLGEVAGREAEEQGVAAVAAAAVAEGVEAGRTMAMRGGRTC